MFYGGGATKGEICPRKNHRPTPVTTRRLWGVGRTTPTNTDPRGNVEPRSGPGRKCRKKQPCGEAYHGTETGARGLIKSTGLLPGKLTLPRGKEGTGTSSVKGGQPEGLAEGKIQKRKVFPVWRKAGGVGVMKGGERRAKGGEGERGRKRQRGGRDERSGRVKWRY